ncbi:MAG TPA: ku family containing domain-containing protein [Burkholderiales bacterium]|nr:ku family containing domain-containing protein [Burkholderiales bacterium]
MPDKRTMQRVERDRKQGKSASTQAGEFVREEIDHIRAGKHGARSAGQAIAIGLSKARRAGVGLPPPGSGASPRVRRKAARDSAAGHRGDGGVSARRSRATTGALKRAPRVAASTQALSRQARAAASRRSAASRSASARKAAATKGAAARSIAAHRAARTRAAHAGR